MNLPKIHSITKKLLVALVGGFLLIFLLFHATANMFVLRHDDGAWYSAFCHFMGSNVLVKIIEIVLLGVLLLHILLTLWLTATNSTARPKRYHHKPETKTHSGSTLMALTGILIFAFLVMHFCQFYFVKIGWVKGEYMVETAKLQDTEVQVMELVQRAYEEGNFTEDQKWIRHLSYDDRQMLRRMMPESKPEPDFYFMVRELFHNPIMVLLYLITFVALFFHIRHAFPSAFQTLGLNNYTYGRAIDIIGRIYAWVICLMFAIVPVLVYFGM